MQEPGITYSSTRRAWFVVAVLTILNTASFIDRQILSLLVEPIRADLHIGDTAISLLMGFSYALFFTAAGLVVSRLVDSGSRRGLIAVSFTARGIFTSLSALVPGLPFLAAMRMAAGVGQSGFSTSAYSLLSDYFPAQRRTTAISVYQIGIYAGSGLAFIIGGGLIAFTSHQTEWILPLVGAVKPWQLTLLLTALPGLFLTPLVFTIAEPARQETRAGPNSGGVPVKEVREYFRSIRAALIPHNLGFGLVALGGYAMGAWNPAFFIRRFGWTATEAGLIVGGSSLIAGLAGTIGGGRLADALIARGRRDGALRVAVWAISVGAPLAVGMYFAPTAAVAIALQIPVALALSCCSGIGIASLQQVIPNQMRGQASALFVLVVTTLGLGAGPTAVAAFAEFVLRDDQRLHVALAVVIGSAWAIAAVLLYRAAKPFAAAAEALSRNSK